MVDAECPCTGKNLSKLLQPAIFTVLAAGPLHGYLVVEKVSELELCRGKKPDPTGVYRTLRQMEERGYLLSTWDTTSSGPARKRYRVTRAGRRCLDTWVDTLISYRQAIDQLLERFRKTA